MISLLEKIVIGVNTASQRGIDLVASRWGAQTITFDQFKTELETLTKSYFLYSNGYYPDTPSKGFPKVGTEISADNLSSEEVKIMFARDNVIVPAFDINDSDRRAWINFAEYDPHAYRFDLFVIKRREKSKNNTVSFEISIEDLPALDKDGKYSRISRFAHFEIKGYKVPTTAPTV